jgi:hypothetical protein
MAHRPRITVLKSPPSPLGPGLSPRDLTAVPAHGYNPQSSALEPTAGAGGTARPVPAPPVMPPVTPAARPPAPPAGPIVITNPVLLAALQTGPRPAATTNPVLDEVLRGLQGGNR